MKLIQLVTYVLATTAAPAGKKRGRNTTLLLVDSMKRPRPAFEQYNKPIIYPTRIVSRRPSRIDTYPHNCARSSC